MNTERNCQTCKYYKDGYCENLELKPCYPQKGCDDFENKDLDVLDKIRAEIKGKIEQEEFARSVFRHEEKDTAKAEQCTGSIMAYNNVIKLIDKYKADRSEK